MGYRQGLLLLLPLAAACGAAGVQFGLPAGIDPDGGTTTPPATSDGGTANTGLPCDVANLLQSRCDSCHGNPPSAPVSIVTYDDLQKTDPSDPTKTVAQESLIRMQSSTSPMPPGMQLPSSEIAILQNWINAGMPKGQCGAPDAGTTSSAPVCTSMTYWQPQSDESASMDPGLACIACHSAQGGPSLAFGGTVYPTPHEPDECYGASGAMVIVTDAAGHSVSVNTGSTGNFSYQSRTTTLQFPITAKVQTSRGTLTMQTPQMSGDCNSCHTENGANGAPGRIYLP